MIRTYTIYNKKDKYTLCNDKQDEIFEINKSLLSVDVIEKIVTGINEFEEDSS